MFKIRFILAIVFAASVLTLGAQGLGLRGGVNFQNINGKDAIGDKLENNLLVGYHLGLNVELPIAPTFFLQPGLLFSTKGSKDEFVFVTETIDTKVILGYLEVPLNLVFKPAIGDGNLILGFGPYFAYAINGKIKGEGDDFDIEFKSEVGEGDDEEIFYFRRFDAGANLLVGYEWAAGLFLQLNAQLGLMNINSDYNDERKMNNTGFGFSAGYRFN